MTDRIDAPRAAAPTPLAVAVVASLATAVLLVLGEQALLGFAPLGGDGGGGAFLLVQLGVHAAFALAYGLAIAAFLGGLRRTVAVGPTWRAAVERVRSDPAADVRLTATLFAAAVSVALVVVGFVVVYGGKDPEFLAKPGSAGPYFAFFVLVLIVVGVAAFFPLHAVLTWKLRTLRFDRWFRSGRLPLVARSVLLTVGLVVLAAAALLWKLLGNYEMANVLRFPLFLLVFVLLHAAVMVGVWALRRPLRPLLGRVGVAAVALVTVAIAAVPLFGLGSFPAVRDRLEADTVYVAGVAGVLRGVLDLDRDGYAWVLDGGDCDDLSRAVNPDADEVPGDGVDNDCRGGDASDGGEGFALDPSLTEPAEGGGAPETAAAADAAEESAEVVAPRAAAGATEEQDPAAAEGAAADAAEAKAPAPEPPPKPPIDREKLADAHLVVILIDTVRADHVSYYGYERETTPNIDAVARESVVFRKAYAQANHTPRSMPSIFTGLHPSEIAWKKRYRNFSPILDRNVTYYELLQDQGFTTVGVFAHWYFGEERNLQQGFDVWDNKGAKSLAEGNTLSPAPLVTRKTLAHFERLTKEGERIAAFVHYMDPHSRYMKHSRLKVFGGNKTLLDKYDGEIFWTDHYVGELLEGMKELGMYENSVIVVMADHGEAFKDHKSYFHGMTLYREEIEVPLIVRIPGVEPRDVEQRVALLDLFPTVLDLFQVPYDGHVPGVSLVDTGIRGKPRGKPVYAELLKYPSWKEDIRALYVGDLKIIWNMTKNLWELFDLAADPTEQVNVYRKHPKAAAMKKALQDWMDHELVKPSRKKKPKK